MLTTSEIKKQMQQGNIVIKNLDKNPLSKPNSCDLRIGNTLYTFDYDIIDTKESTKYLQEVLYDKTTKLKKVIIPIGCTGYQSEEIWKEVNPPKFLRDHKNLSKSDNL